MPIFVYRNNQQIGPFEHTEIQQKLADGSLSLDDLGWDQTTSQWMPLRVIFAATPQPVAVYPPPPPTASGISPTSATENAGLQCQVCRQGTLVKRKKYRMSTPVVVIGYILLIPSIFGVLAGCMLLFATGGSSGNAIESIRDEARAEMTEAGVPPVIIESVISSEANDVEEYPNLTPEQRTAISNAMISLSAGAAGAGVGAFLAGGFSFFVIVSAFVGGLLGWLLIMKKRVLECNNCGAVVAAS